MRQSTVASVARLARRPVQDSLGPEAQGQELSVERRAMDPEDVRGPADVSPLPAQDVEDVSPVDCREALRAVGAEGVRRPSAAQASGESVRGQCRPTTQDTRPLDHVLQLAHVARPPVLDEPAETLGGDGLGSHAQGPAESRHEMGDEEGDVSLPLSQRRKFDLHHVEAMVP